MYFSCLKFKGSRKWGRGSRACYSGEFAKQLERGVVWAQKCRPFFKGDRGHRRRALCRERQRSGLGHGQISRLSEYGQWEEEAEGLGFLVFIVALVAAQGAARRSIGGGGVVKRGAATVA